MLNEYFTIEKSTLKIDYRFDDEIKNLPKDIKEIIFTENIIFTGKDELSKFNKSVDKLPENLTHLTFGSLFNQYIKVKEIISIYGLFMH